MKTSLRLFALLPILLGGLLAFKALQVVGLIADTSPEAVAEEVDPELQELAKKQGFKKPDKKAEGEEDTDQKGKSATADDIPDLKPTEKAKEEPQEIERAACDASAAIAEASGLSQSEVRVLQSLSGRRAELEQREEELDTREKLLAAAEGKIDDRVRELEALQSEIEIMLNLADEKKQEQIDRLVGIYEKMKPKDSARIFEKLEENLAVQVVAGMKPQAVAAMLANMNPEEARRLTTLLASKPPSISRDELQTRLGS